MRPEQLALDLALRPALGREAFVVTRANMAALEILERGPWPGGRLALSGPAASGKTHLAHVWAADTGAVIVGAAELARLDTATLAGAGRIAVEDVPAIGGDAAAETALFHLYNRMGAAGGFLLLTGRTLPAYWPLALPDLCSRMRALTAAELNPPDEALLGALLEKQFADRGMDVAPQVLMFLVPRMPRTAAAARALATEIDRLSLARQQTVTVPLARLALDRVSSLCHTPAPGDQP